MDPNPHEQDILRAVEEDHKALLALLTELHRAAGERNTPPEEVCRMLGQLADHLLSHFELEERGGYFSDAVAHAPQLADRADGLLEEHPRMAEAARELADWASAAMGSDTWWDELAERFGAFREKLLAHERNEDRLIQEAYTRDLGAKD